MLDAKSRSGRDFSHFDTLSTDELRAIIHHDSMLDENEDSDPDAIVYILEVLARREKEEKKEKNVDAAWQSFLENYYPCPPDPELLSDLEEKMAPAKRPSTIRLFKSLSVAAILALVLLTGTATSYAFGFDLWGAVARWSQETFGFSDREEPETLPFKELRTALSVNGVEESLVPDWLPKGYGGEILEISEVPDGMYFTATYKNGSLELSMDVHSYQKKNIPHSTYEHLGSDIEIYASNEIEHYIAPNGEMTAVVWQNNNNECSIICSLEKEEIYRMIDSIYER